MSHLMFWLFCMSILSTVIAIFLYIGAARDRDYFMAVNSKYWRELQSLKYPAGEPVKGARERFEDAIESRNRDVAEGIKIIENQKATINSLKALLKQSQDRNRLQKRRK
jgi:hypothetical protein